MSRPAYRRVLGVDAAARTGWAIVDARGRRPTRLVKAGSLRPTPVAVADLVRHLCEPSVRPDLVAIEDQYLGVNVRTLKRLVEARTRFMQAFEQAGVPVVLVAAADWQMGLLRGMIHGRSPRKDRKHAAMEYGKRTFGEHAADNQDEWDAACIAVFAIKRGLGAP